jgi:predicted dehydrogenase
LGSRNRLNRRRFISKALGTAAGVAGFPYFVPSAALGKAGAVAPSNRIVMGAIGVGSKGGRNILSFTNRRDVQTVAVCDVDAGHRDTTANNINSKYDNRDCASYNDFRELIAREDIDAVSIGTPDHWHAIPAVAAARAKKDIFAEKPLAYSIAEGRAICDAVKQYRVVWQTGSQQRSDRRFRFACELVRNGRIGKVHTVRVGLPAGGSDRNGKASEPAAVPQGFDYDMWLGPAPWAAYCPDRCHGNFRWMTDYSGGQITDWAGHHCDIAQWGMGTELTGPVEIEGGGRAPQDGLWNTLYEYRFVCNFAEGFTMIVADNRKHRQGVLFEGTDGWVYVRRGEIDAHPKSLLESEIGPDEIHLYQSTNHKGNFIDCVRSRRETVAPAEVAQRSISIGHLGLTAMKLGRKLNWDPRKERFLNDQEANRFVARPMRSPWHL